MLSQTKLIEWRAREAVAKAAEAALKSYKAMTAELEAELLEAFADEGVHSIKIDSPPALVMQAESERFAKGFQIACDGASVALGTKQTIFLWSQWFGVPLRKTDDQGNELDEPDTAAFIQRMREHGYGDLVSESINYNTLGAWIREHIPDGDIKPVLPPELEGTLSTAQKFELRARKA